jgi:hypothetical protein
MYSMLCTGSLEYAYVYSDKFYNMSWLKHSPEADDPIKIEYVNSNVKQQCPNAVEIDTYITGRVKKTLTEIYLGPNIMLVPEDNMTLVPKHLFIQRLTSRTKTFDLVVVEENKATVISAVDKNDLEDIQRWHKAEIYCGGADPLPVKNIVKALQHQTYKEVCNALDIESDSDEDWIPESSEESEESDYESD